MLSVMILEVKIVLETLIKPLFCNLELEMSPVTIHDSVSSRWTGALSSVRMKMRVDEARAKFEKRVFM